MDQVIGLPRLAASSFFLNDLVVHDFDLYIFSEE